jgi:hypothetical protein
MVVLCHPWVLPSYFLAAECTAGVWLPACRGTWFTRPGPSTTTAQCSAINQHSGAALTLTPTCGPVSRGWGTWPSLVIPQQNYGAWAFVIEHIKGRCSVTWLGNRFRVVSCLCYFLHLLTWALQINCLCFFDLIISPSDLFTVFTWVWWNAIMMMFMVSLSILWYIYIYIFFFVKGYILLPVLLLFFVTVSASVKFRNCDNLSQMKLLYVPD